jgi:hypothetical protein
MSKADKRENIIMIASEPLTFERGKVLRTLCATFCSKHMYSGLDGNQNQPHGNYNKEDESTSDSDYRQILRTFSPATHH